MMTKYLYAPLDWLVEYKSQITTIIFFIWLAVVLYWFYRFNGVTVAPLKSTGVVVENLQDNDDGSISSRAALAFIFWAATSGIFVVGFVVYALKFIYNILMGMIYGAVPTKVHKLVTPVMFLIAMWPCFSYQKEIKTAYVVLYREGSDIIRLASGFDMKVEINTSLPEPRDGDLPSGANDDSSSQK
ncbi:membrane protein [Candidatus Magnetobacterium bavaricum]|uniref:Membrane protein n=1 Tax=Candidatus Magnetobacterium bavaricum TaxID=29290 RepID=A0A0F3GUV9_9BACT|nr:membrane protein [Candidatus Magnetobacterium bavaricum]